jgi:hypothetical protein
MISEGCLAYFEQIRFSYLNSYLVLYFKFYSVNNVSVIYNFVFHILH